MNRRTFVRTTVAAAASSLLVPAALAQPLPKAKNVVLVHGLFADGSCWTEVIPQLQVAGLNVTAVQNPLTTLPEAVASALRVLARQGGPTVLVGHSFFAGDLPEAKAKVLYAVQWPKPSWYAVSTEDRTINPDLERFMAKRMGAKTIETESQSSFADLPPKGNLSTDPGGGRTDLGRGGASTNGGDVRFWHIADIRIIGANVRFRGKADIEWDYPATLPQFCAKCSAPRSETAKMV